jgi:hypothetical protein
MSDDWCSMATRSVAVVDVRIIVDSIRHADPLPVFFSRSVDSRIVNSKDPQVLILDLALVANALPRDPRRYETVQVTCKNNSGSSRRRRNPQEYKSTAASVLVHIHWSMAGRIAVEVACLGDVTGI